MYLEKIVIGGETIYGVDTVEDADMLDLLSVDVPSLTQAFPISSGTPVETLFHEEDYMGMPISISPTDMLVVMQYSSYFAGGGTAVGIVFQNKSILSVDAASFATFEAWYNGQVVALIGS